MVPLSAPTKEAILTYVPFSITEFLIVTVFFPEPLPETSPASLVLEPDFNVTLSTTTVHGILINADTGEVLYDKYKDFQTYPASTTKVMTALLALEHLDLDQVCTISHDASYTEGSRIFLLEL